ncbi:MAG TPA: PIN domain-containing protein [Polyangia bacterium]|jgi:predicted nucleic acid-binding protein|nr:PIN domain-containing protein [Polyangia bacterium]
MIYLDTSVALAHLLAEDRHPPDNLWTEVLVSSRLIEYELWNRLHARGLAGSHGAAARTLLGHLAMIELSPTVLSRALEPFPVPVRTLDALHLASADFLRGQKQAVEVASYDDRMAAAARKMGFAIARSAG